MAKVVGGLALSHGSVLVSNADLVPKSDYIAAIAAYKDAARTLRDLQPDALLLLVPDHFNTFGPATMPQCCIGLSEEYAGWGDNVPMYSVPGASELAAEVCSGLLQEGLAVAHSGYSRLDHAVFSVLHFLTPDMDIPIIPVWQNCVQAPFLPPAWAFELGTRLRAAIDSALPNRGQRVVAIATGGLSHWLGLPQQGRVNREFDQMFLEEFVAGEFASLLSMASEELSVVAGNGGQEVRNWIALRGLLMDAVARCHYYAPLEGWLTGWAIASLTSSVSAESLPRGERTGSHDQRTGPGEGSSRSPSRPTAPPSDRTCVMEAIRATYLETLPRDPLHSGDGHSARDGDGFSSLLRRLEMAKVRAPVVSLIEAFDREALLAWGLNPISLIQLGRIRGSGPLA